MKAEIAMHTSATPRAPVIDAITVRAPKMVPIIALSLESLIFLYSPLRAGLFLISAEIR